MASTSESSDPSATIPVTKKYNFRNPLPLSASQEQEVKQLYYKRVRARCAPEIKGSYLVDWWSQMNLAQSERECLSLRESAIQSLLSRAWCFFSRSFR